MGLKRIFIAYHTPRTTEVIQWFHDTFGAPELWDNENLQPVKIRKGRYWITGSHRLPAYIHSSPCIWCTDKAFMMYKLRWL